MGIRQKGQFSTQRQRPQVVEGTLVSSALVPRRKIFPPWLLPSLLLIGVVALSRELWSLRIFQSVPSPVTITVQPKEEVKTATLFVRSQAHVLTATSPAQTETVKATGKRLLAASRATGSLLFYNQQTSAQRLSAGVRIAVSPTLQIETDGAVNVPPGNPPASGEAQVQAHVVQPGAAGNITAGTLNGACSCQGAVDIRVQNLSFSGGRDQMTESLVQASDIDQVVNSGKGQRLQTVRQNVLQQLATDERLATSLSCVQHVQADHQGGDVAESVAVSIITDCTALAFVPSALQQQAITSFMASVGRGIDPKYRVIHTSATLLQKSVLDAAKGTLAATLLVTGKWTYQLSSAECQRVRLRLAGISYAQALHLLHTTLGIAEAKIEPKDDTLPENPGLITLRLRTSSS